jgi:hypothetical protein
MPEKFGEKHIGVTKPAEKKPDAAALIEQRVHEFVAVYGTVFETGLTTTQKAMVRETIANELLTTGGGGS